MRIQTAVSVVVVLLLHACVSPYKPPDLGGLYNDLVQHESPRDV